ncbi:MAG: TolC family outer membrane protein [Pseudomonadota bacterium]|nr:TolC family outer membrane protein [Pseudomonadota bacterium]
MTPSMPRTLVRALFQSGLIASTLTSAAAFAEASDASTSDFASAGPAWVSPELPVGSSGSTAAWDNTLAGVYELALRNDPVLAAAEATFRAGSEERRIGLGGLLPQVNAEYSIVDVDQDSDGAFAAGAQVFPNQTESEVDQTDWALRLQQPLFNVSAWFNFRRGAELTEQATATFEQAQQDLIVRVVGTYFSVLRAGANLSASRAQEDALEAQLDQVRQRFEVGLVAMTDVFDAQAAYDTAVADRVADAAALDVALELLAVITGQEHAALWGLDEDFPVIDPTPGKVDDWLEFALQNNIDLDVARLGRDASLASARAAASAHLPTVALSLSRTASNADIDQLDLISNTASVFERNNDTDTIALSFSMPLYSGGVVSARRRQAYAQYDSSAQLVERTKRNVTQLTRAQYINVKRDVARTRARAQAIISTQSALEAAQTGYEVGTRNVVDVLIAQRAVFSAIRDHANSIIDFVQDVVSLKRQAGILTPADIVELNRWLREPEAVSASMQSMGSASGDAHYAGE